MSRDDALRSHVVIESTRGEVVENRHLVSLAVVDADGGLVRSDGDVDSPVPARSTVKPIQALALLRSGAADAFDVTDEEIAITCGSHSGENGHLQLVQRWLDRIGLTEDDLGCAPNPPMGEPDGAPARRLANNCSGKHTGFLTVAVHLGANPGEYLDAEGPVQRLVLDGVAEACGSSLGPENIGRDGCSAPAPALSLHALARGLARTLLDADDEVGMRIANSMATHPWMVGGTDRYDTNLTTATDGQVLAKAGAAGTHVAVDRANGLALAAKCHDGSRHPVEFALTWALVELGAVSVQALDALVDRSIVDHGGHPVGELRLAS